MACCKAVPPSLLAPFRFCSYLRAAGLQEELAIGGAVAVSHTASQAGVAVGSGPGGGGGGGGGGLPHQSRSPHSFTLQRSRTIMQAGPRIKVRHAHVSQLGDGGNASVHALCGRLPALPLVCILVCVWQKRARERRIHMCHIGVPRPVVTGHLRFTIILLHAANPHCLLLTFCSLADLPFSLSRIHCSAAWTWVR